MTYCELHLKECVLAPLLADRGDEIDYEEVSMADWEGLYEDALEDGDDLGGYDGDPLGLEF